ncbi:MAG: HAD-IIIC family phosphatase, partial [Casimicrobiaceae bacterium]
MTDEAAATLANIATDEGEQLRREVSARFAAGQTSEAVAAARNLLDRIPGLPTFRFLRKLVGNGAGRAAGLKPMKIALLSSFSIEFIHDSFCALGVASGLDFEIFQPGFGSFRQAILDADSALYAFAPDVVVLAVEGSAWAPAAYDGYLDTADDQLRRLPQAVASELQALVAALRARCTAPLLIHNFARPLTHRLGIADAKREMGQEELIAQINATLAELARDASDMHIVDYAGLVNRNGARNWYDDRMRLYAQAPIANAMLPELAGEYLKFMRALAGLTKKCLVVDLDNTLWGGVVGEDGVDALQLGPDYPGNAYVEFQRYLLGLSRRGILLAIASKNNVADVDEVFAGHRSMVLGYQHFAEREIHWEPKSRSLARIAQRLGIGLEHIVFVDDNPAECVEVRRALPMVRVIELPRQPERFVRTLDDAGLFDSLRVTAEDMRRGDMYR